MMRRPGTLIALSAWLAAPAIADTAGVLKQNTLVLREADGRTHTLLLSERGAMEQVNASGMWASGNWAIEERGLCWTARGAARLCIPLPADKAVGDSWEITGPTGKLIWTAEIVAGRASIRDAASEAPGPGGDPEAGDSGH